MLKIKKTLGILLAVCFVISVTATAASATHGATIIIKNYCDKDMMFGMEKTCHGKYTVSPPQEIKSGATGSFRVSPKSGASIGPKGWVRYNMAVNDKIESFQIFWDHPVGSKKTRYEYSSEPYAIDLTQDPSGTVKGKEQTVTITLRKILESEETTIDQVTCSH